MNEQVESMAKTTMAEVEKVLNSKTVVGDPIVVGETTLIPLLSIGFGFGAGGGSGRGESKQQGQGSGEGMGGGTGAGAWVKPIAVIIIDKEGVSVEPIRGGLAMAAERLAEAIPEMMMMCMEKWHGGNGGCDCGDEDCCDEEMEDMDEKEG